MKLIYIDESGNTGTHFDHLQPIHLLAALIIDEKDIRSIEDEIRKLGLKYFGLDSLKQDFEFHGYQIHKGRGYFSKIPVEKRIEMMDDLLNLIKTYKVYIVYTTVKNSGVKFHPHPLSFFALIQGIEDYLIANQALGLLVADENQEVERTLLQILEHNKTQDIAFKVGFRSEFNRINRIVDSIHFVKSHSNRLIQLADIVAYILARGVKVQEELERTYKNHSQEKNIKMSFVDWINEFASAKQKIEFKHFKLLISKAHRNVQIKSADVII